MTDKNKWYCPGDCQWLTPEGCNVEMSNPEGNLSFDDDSSLPTCWMYMKPLLTPEPPTSATTSERLLTKEEIEAEFEKHGYTQYHYVSPCHDILIKAQDAKSASLVARQERERIIDFMTGRCVEHWINSRPYRWKCEECWQALKQGKERVD